MSARNATARNPRPAGNRTRILAVLAIVGVLVLGLFAAQAKNSSKNDLARTPVPASSSSGPKLIVVDPRLLPLPDGQFIAGAWKRGCGSTASAQYFCLWDRDDKDPGAATGAGTVAMNGRLYLNLDDAAKSFASTEDGATAEFIINTTAFRGFDKDQIRVLPITIDDLGLDQQACFRAEYSRASERYAQYWCFLRRMNTRAYFNTFGQIRDGVEGPNLLPETVQIAKLQADYMKSFPLSDAGPIITATP